MRLHIENSDAIKIVVNDFDNAHSKVVSNSKEVFQDSNKNKQNYE